MGFSGLERGKVSRFGGIGDAWTFVIGRVVFAIRKVVGL